MALNFVGGVKNLTSSVSTLNKELTSVYDVLKKIKGIGPSAFGNINAVLHNSGQMNNGSSSPLFSMNPSIPSSKNNYGNNTLDASNPASAAQENAYRASGITSARMSIYSAGLSTAAGVVSGFSSMLPNLGDVVSRGSSYYQSAAMFGGTNAMGLQRRATAAMSGGITGNGSDAAATGVLTMGYNFAPGGSSMMSALGQVSGAAKALNMDNAAAAAAVGGMATGQMGAQLYQYGIRQFDNKGNQRPMDQIAKDLLKNYFYAGKDITKLSPNQLSRDLQYGGLQTSLNDMGFTQDQQSIIKRAWGEQIQGRSGSLTDKSVGAGNPANPAYKINQSQAELANAVQEPLIQGFSTAASAVTALNKALEGTPDLILQMKGAMQGFNGSNVGQGASQVTNSLLKGSMDITQNLLLLKALKSGTTAGSLLSKGGSLLSKGGSLLKAGAIVGGTQIAGSAIQGNSGKGSFRHRAGNAAKWAGITAAIPVLGETVLPEILAGAIGYATGGSSAGFNTAVGGSSLSMFSGSSSPMASGQAGSSMGSTSASLSAGFGAKDLSMWSGAKNYHTGQDFVMPIGTPVKAQYAGTVVDRNPGKDLGIYVQIDHGDGHYSIYGHLNQKLVHPGQTVAVGTLIGKSGATGKVSGPHLHFEIRKGNTPVNPTTYRPKTQHTSGGSKSPTVTGSSTSQTVSGQQVPKGPNSIILGKGDKKAWAIDFLTRLGEPTTKSNVNAITTWMAWEGGNWKNSAHWNPLNTTLSAKGAKSINSHGVKSFTSYEQGMTATLNTINVDKYGYPAIKSALQKGDDAQAVISAINASAWGTKIKGGGTQGFSADVPVAAGGGASSYSSMATGQGSSTNNVYVTLQINQASQQEAEEFAQKIKTYLEKDNHRHMMGSR